MRHRWLLRALAAGAVLFPVVGGAQATSPAGDAAGYRMTMVGSSTATGMLSAAVPSSEVTYKVRILDGVMRMDFDKAVSPVLREGMYTLLDAKTMDMQVVDTAARQITSMNSMENLAAMGGMPEMTISDTSSQLEDLGPGETVLGFPTRKYRVSMRYAMGLGPAGAGMVAKVATVATVQVSDAIAALDPAFDAFRAKFMTNAGVPGTGTAAAQLAALTRVQPRGFALISEQEMTMDLSGNETVMKSSFRVTSFARGGVTASDVTAPGGFSVNDITATMKRMVEEMREDDAAPPVPVKPVKP